jgi:hypothetical protein
MKCRTALTALTMILAAAATSVAAAQTAAGSPLMRARQAYNAGEFDAAIAAATDARRTPAAAAPANVVYARALLERFRLQSDGADLVAAHDALMLVDPMRLSAAERLDYTVALAITTYFEGRPGVAAELLETLLDGAATSSSSLLGDRRALFDWWATAADRAAQLAPDLGKHDFYLRIVRRSEAELARDAASIPAGYWLAAGARGAGDLDRAWHAAIAAWIRSRTNGRRDIARADLDDLVTSAIIPERARALEKGDAATRDHTALIAAMRAEWEQIKIAW